MVTIVLVNYALNTPSSKAENAAAFFQSSSPMKTKKTPKKPSGKQKPEDIFNHNSRNLVTGWPIVRDERYMTMVNNYRKYTA